MERFVYKNGFPSVWEVRHPEDVVRLLKSDQVEIPDVSELLRFIEKKFGVELVNLREIASMTPIFLDGPDARQYRKDLAIFYAGQVDRIGAELRNSLPGILDNFVSRPVADVEYDLARPVSRCMFAAILGQDPPESVFEFHLGELFNLEERTLTNLRRIDASAAEALDLARTLTPKGEPVRLVLSLLIFGVDSLVATFLGSVASAVRSSSRVDPVLLQLPTMPPRTGISVTYRTVRSDIAIGDIQFRRGEVLKLNINPDTDDAIDTDSSIIFGAGAHSCLGRGIAMTVWTEVINQVNARRLRIYPEEMERARYRFGKVYTRLKVGIVS